MGASKINEYGEKQLLIAKYAKDLSHPARIAILDVLLNKQTCVCGDIVEELPIAQSTVSQHLKELKNMGLIQGTIEGTSVCYCINEAKWAEMKEVLSLFLDQKKEPKISCCS